jgi:arylsulfatase A-like enzyme
LNTGRLFRDGPEWPSAGAVVDHLFRRERKWHDVSSWSVWPDTRINTGISIGHGQSAGWLDLGAHAPGTIFPHHQPTNRFAEYCSMARARAAHDVFGHQFVTINQFSTVFDSPSWDCHADRGSLSTDLNDYHDAVAPAFDTAFAALLTDLEARGLLDSTLVVATGEFGRTPLLNANGGRDHWASCWTALVAGGGVKGGRVVGASDNLGGEPKDRPVTPQELVATIFHALGVPPVATIPGPTGEPVAVYPGRPVAELF